MKNPTTAKRTPAQLKPGDKLPNIGTVRRLIYTPSIVKILLWEDIPALLLGYQDTVDVVQ
jgi:hypothetical protein